MSNAWAGRVLADSAVDRDSWILARAHMVTASDVANILGLGSKSRGAVRKEKMNGANPEDDPSEFAQVASGRYLENGIWNWFVAETLHETANSCGQLIHAPEPRRWLGATPDAVLDNEPVEIKNSLYSSRPSWHVETTSKKGWPAFLPWPKPIAANTRFAAENLRTARDDVGTARGTFRDGCRFHRESLFPEFGDLCAPIKYWVQLQVQMHVLQADRGWVVGCWAGGNRFDLYYERHRAFEAWMLAEVDGFWEEIKICETKS